MHRMMGLVPLVSTLMGVLVGDLVGGLVKVLMDVLVGDLVGGLLPLLLVVSRAPKMLLFGGGRAGPLELRTPRGIILVLVIVRVL